MIHTAFNDGSDPTFGVERNYLNAKKAYRLLGETENICLSYRITSNIGKGLAYG